MDEEEAQEEMLAVGRAVAAAMENDKALDTTRPYFVGKRQMQSLMEEIEREYGDKGEHMEAIFGAFTCTALALYASHEKADAEKIIRSACGIAVDWLEAYRAEQEAQTDEETE
tara:strand:- start:12056 stop:12394 length:339 start_codon:yes stop_codon:yes gene_type:complete